MNSVSVIIPTFNRARKVVRAVSSVLYQTFGDYEIIVVDDGSTDDTIEALAPVRAHIQYISHPNNLGVSVARNTGIQASRSPLIAFLDSDDYWLPDKLTVQVDFFRTLPAASACQTEEIWIRNGRRINPRKKHLKPSGDIFEPSLKLCLVSPSAVMLKRSLLNEVGLFDPDLPACEDYDLWLRISCLHPIYLIEQPLVFKEGGAADQLSACYKGMDRFRIKAMVKLIKGNKLSDSQQAKVFRELSLKCRIYGNGCLKRSKKEEGEFYLGLPGRLQSGEKIDSSTDFLDSKTYKGPSR
jgi:glycosyltransferase involved in cell wall biosynthesis